MILLKSYSNSSQTFGFICSWVYTHSLSPIPEPGWVQSAVDRYQHDMAGLLQMFCQFKEAAPQPRAAVVQGWKDTANLCQVVPGKGRK